MVRNLALALLLSGCTESTVATPGDPRSSGDPYASGDTPGDPGSGDPVAGDPTGGDPNSGDPLAGDPLAGDPVAGDPIAGDPPTGGDPNSGDPLAGDPNATCDLKCEPDPTYAMVECISMTDGTVTVDLVRKTLYSICAGGCFMEPVTLRIQRSGRSDCFTDPGAMTYTNTHHNWMDTVSACATDICYLLATTVDYSGPSMVFDGALTGTTPGTGDVILGPLNLEGTDRVTHF